MSEICTFLTRVSVGNLCAQFVSISSQLCCCESARMVSSSVMGTLAACASELHVSPSSSILSWNRSSVASSCSSSSLVTLVGAPSARSGVRGGCCAVQVTAGVASSHKTDALQYGKLGDSDLVVSELTPDTGTAVDDDDDEGAAELSTRRSLSPTACPSCGKDDMVGGCNGEGRILGGLGSVPGFGWFPIKAYRPCPAFVEAGGRYKRQGQSLEEVAFGRMGKQDGLDITERLQGGNKKQPKK